MTVVNHWGFWIDTEEPVTGVISCNSLEWIHEDTESGINLSYEEGLRFFILEKTGEWQNAQEDINAAPDEDLIEEWQTEFGEYYEETGDTYLIGSWRVNDEGEYEEDTEGEYAAIVNYDSNVVQVVWSRYATRGALCSPCYPGQVDLDTEGEFIAYDLPLEIYGEFRQNTNPQIALAAAPDEEPTE